MSGPPIVELNRGYDALRELLSADPLVRKQAEIAVVTFGGAARLAVPFTESRDLAPATFAAAGNTALGDWGLTSA
jgi:uncharacterized protein YegL